MDRLRIGIRYLLIWLIYFVVAKAVFLVYQHRLTADLSWLNIILVFYHGAKLDLSFAAYLSVLPFFLLTISHFGVSINLLHILLRLVVGIFIVIVSVLTVADLELFEAWEYRIDPSLLRYLTSPEEVWASAYSSPLVLLFFLLTMNIWALWRSLQKWVFKPFGFLVESKNALMVFIWLVITCALILPIRGGTQLSPLNQSSVYFSNQQFANLAAINPAWNFFSAIVNETYETVNPYQYMSIEKAQKLTRQTLKQLGTAPRLLNTKQPNVLIIVWESLTAKVVAPLGGQGNVTPNFNRLLKEGLFFTNVLASGDRSDKGLIAILSGYPAQSLTSIMTVPQKTAKLPSLAHQLAQHGYHTSFYYGGEPEFANIKSYLLSSGYQHLTTKENFKPSDWNSKWGAHDHVVYQRLLNDLNKTQQPFFATFFTLSSHEPFEVPMKPVFEGNEKTDGFLNSHRYADQCLGQFIAHAKRQAWYNNTLIIIVADHGHTLPESASKRAAYAIPMLWVGGALKSKGGIITAPCSQIDIPTTLLDQLGYSTQAFTWSQNLFVSKPTPFAYSAFHNGFIWQEKDGYVVFDHVSKQIIEQAGSLSAQSLLLGKAYAMSSYQDYLEK